MKTLGRRGWAILAATLLAIGCNPSAPGPSYADLVVIYNAEVEALDRLIEKRKALQTEIDTISKPSKMDAAASKLKQLLESAENLKEQNQDKLPSDPDGLLNRVLENSEQAEAIATQALEAMTRPSVEQLQQQQDRLVELRVQLSELDKEIATQTQRVERAKQNRDRAELRP